MYRTRIDALILAAIAGIVVAVVACTQEETAAVATLTSALIGVLGAAILQTCQPPPDPSVPAGALNRLLHGESTALSGPVPLRKNVIVLAIIGGTIVLAVLIIAGATSAALNIAGIIVGGIASGIGRLLDPDEPTVPASVVRDVLTAIGKPTTQ